MEKSCCKNFSSSDPLLEQKCDSKEKPQKVDLSSLFVETTFSTLQSSLVAEATQANVKNTILFSCRLRVKLVQLKSVQDDPDNNSLSM